MNWIRRVLIAGLSCAAVFAFNANAVPVTWTLQGVTFADGGIANGSFTYDADTNTVISWTMTTSGGNTTNFPSPFTYSSSFANSNAFLLGPAADGQAFIFDSDSTAGGSRDLRLDPITLLTNAGGTIALDLGNPNRNVECFSCAPFRLISGGSVAAVVPEPGSLALLGIGLAGLGLRRRAKR